MSDVETLMWRLERGDARYRSVITVVVGLDRSPGLDALRRRVEVLTRQLPRFRARVAPAPTSLATPHWVLDEEFDLALHVRSSRAPGEGRFDDVLDEAAVAAADGLDPSRPLWRVQLVEGMAGGRAAVVVRLHHTFTDGLGALKLASVLFDLDPDAPAPTLAADEPGPPPEDPVARLVGDLRHEAGRAAGLVRWALPAVGGLVHDAATDPERRAGEVTRLAASMAGALTPSSRPCSPVMTGRSSVARFATLRLDLDEARHVGRAGGATVNDVFLSAVVDGLRRYHLQHGSRPEALRIGVPLNLRAAGDDSLRNQFFPARFLVPLQVEDPMDRLRAIHQLVLAQRAQPALAAYEPLAALATRIGGTEAVVGRVLSSVDVMASNVVGSPDPLHLAGTRVLRLVPFGPRTGSGLNLTTLSYDGTLHVGVNMDPAATPDTEVLMACLGEAFERVVIYA